VLRPTQSDAHPSESEVAQANGKAGSRASQQASRNEGEG